MLMVMVVVVVVCALYKGQREIREIAPQLAREEEGLATAANPGDNEEVRGHRQMA